MAAFKKFSLFLDDGLFAQQKMDLPAASSFQIKPELASIIQTEAVKKICQRVLTDTLLGELSQL